jgi:hypothetical protein
MAGTLNKADMYGQASMAWSQVAPTSVSGPAQGSVVPMDKAPPGSATGVGPGVAFSWLGFVLLLVIWRVLIELAK